MRIRRYAILPATVLIACSGPSTSNTDSGQSQPADAGQGSPVDAGQTQPVDSGTSTAMDAGTPPIPDAGTPPNDAGSVGGIPGGVAGPGSTIAGCQIFPNDSPWNVQIDGPNVQVIHTYDSELPSSHPHPDFGDWSMSHYGIPYNVVDAGQPDLPMTFTLYASESDPGPGGWTGADPTMTGAASGTTAYPFYLAMHIEGDPKTGGRAGHLSSDQHGIVLQQGPNGCTAWEAWNCVLPTTPSFQCANGAAFDLTSNALRPAGWTSADAAGLSILAGLVKLAEVQSGAVTHAIRVTFNNTQSGYIAPATHAASPGSQSAAGPAGSAYPPMGLRLRLKANVPTSSYTPASQIVMAAMKKYGLIVADIGSDWYFQGDSDDGWAADAPDGQDSIIDEMTDDFRKLNGSDFEAVYTGDPVDTNL